MNTRAFPPSKRNGLLLHSVLLITLIITCTWGFVNLSHATAGPIFVMFLLVALVAFAPLPLLAYRAYALFRATYILGRDNLQLRWGLRDEDIPLADIEWVRSVQDLAYPLTMPSLPLPGAVLGMRRHRDLGIVEFIASEKKNLLLVATAKRVFAISPANPAEFAQTFARAVELGSLATTKPKSVYPSFIVGQAWASGLIRFLWLAVLFLNVGLAVWISLLIPTLSGVALGFGPNRAAEAVPSVQLAILPLVSSFLALFGWGAGLYFYRWEKQRVLSIIIWTSCTLTSILFLVAILFIVSTPV